METLKLTVNNIKNIGIAEIEIPLEKGVYAFVGNNGCGKSTILLSLAQIISKHYLSTLRPEDYENTSSVEFDIAGHIDKWTLKGNWWNSSSYPNITKMNGMYEGSLFYGTRFNDSRVVDRLVNEGKITGNDIVDADDYIKQKLSFILHGNYVQYKNLKKIRNKFIAKDLNLDNTPYFDLIKNRLISQYRMSSGECMLISLLHFVYNSIVRKSLPRNQPILVLIDEIELALHPIAVSRLLDLLDELVKISESLIVILTTHSPEVIRKIPPKNIFKVENYEGKIDIVNPCYPSYVIRDVYKHDGFDYLLLVEDELAKCVVEKTLFSFNLTNSKLIHVVPAGGWKNVLTLQKDLLEHNVLGIGREIISILDGDVENAVGKEFQDLKKLFLPIKSVEKFLFEVLVTKPNMKFKRILNDKYFTIDSLDTLLSAHFEQYPKNPDHPDKKLYFRLRKNLESRNINEITFINNLCEDIMREIDFSKFKENLGKLIEK